MSWRWTRPVAGLCLAAAVLAAPLRAQSVPWAYDSVYTSLVRMTPVAGQVADVHDLVLQRDAGELDLSSGQLVVLSPVNGRTVAVAFHGQGLFRFRPPTHMERERLREFRNVTELAQPFTDLVLIVCDSTLQELRSRLAFGAGTPFNDVDKRVRDMLTYLGKTDDRSLAPDVLRPLLNREHNSLFYAYMVRGGDDPLMFMIDPYETESVRLLVRARHSGYTRLAEVVCQFPRGGDTLPESLPSQRVREARVARYQIESWLPQTLSGDLSLDPERRPLLLRVGAAGDHVGHRRRALDRIRPLPQDHAGLGRLGRRRGAGHRLQGEG